MRKKNKLKMIKTQRKDVILFFVITMYVQIYNAIAVCGANVSGKEYLYIFINLNVQTMKSGLYL